MSRHPPLTEEQLAVKPVVVSFSLLELVARCPKCRTVKRYKLSVVKPSGGDYCPECLVPWRWS